MSAYYNEIDSFAAAWLRELIKGGHIAPGDVDERSIVDVQPSDLVGYRQCHFFAGIGGWSLALRLAGWADERAVWTGSCPCQPFSSAGAQTGGDDSRHIWPTWARLIRECRPSVVFGEQVEAAIAHGWLDLVCDDLEREDYAVGAVGLPAASVGAPHIRQRLWFVADRDSLGWRGRGAGETVSRPQAEQRSGGCGDADGVADADRKRRSGQRVLLRPEEAGWEPRDVPETAGRSGTVELADADGSECRQGIATAEYASEPVALCGAVGDASGLQRGDIADIRGTRRREEGGGATSTSLWSRAEWLPCRDGKARPVEPGIFPLAYGVSNRVGTLRGAGNAIVPQVAAEVIRAYMEIQ